MYTFIKKYCRPLTYADATNRISNVRHNRRRIFFVFSVLFIFTHVIVSRFIIAQMVVEVIIALCKRVFYERTYFADEIITNKRVTCIFMFSLFALVVH